MSLQYANPVYPEYFADPFVWKHDGVFYAIGTGVVEAHSDLHHVSALTRDGDPGVFLILRSEEVFILGLRSVLRWPHFLPTTATPTGLLRSRSPMADSISTIPSDAETKRTTFALHKALVSRRPVS